MSKPESETSASGFWQDLEHTIEPLVQHIQSEIKTWKVTFQLFRGVFALLFKPPWRGQEIFRAIDEMAFGSLPIVVIATLFAGLVVTHEIVWHLREALHTISLVPGFTGQFILRELGIAIPTFLMVSKVGASITAEIGSMKITEQIDALRLLHVEPIAYLVFPRFVACMVSMAALVLIASMVTLGGAAWVAISHYNFSALEYLNILKRFVGPMDLVCTLMKGLIFGAVIPVIACAYGLEVQKGAQGVGSSTTQSVVTCTLTIIALDFALTYLFSGLLR